MPQIQIGDETIYYGHGKSDGSRNILLIHGAGGDHMTWPWKMRRLPEANVYAVDLPGHGKSSGNGRQSIDEYADFVETLVLELGLGEVTAIGHSMGGAIVQTLAVRSADWMTRAVLVGTGARLRVAPEIVDGILADFESTVGLVCRLAFGPAAGTPVVDAGRDAMLKNDPNIMRNDYIACDRFDAMDAVRKISIPVLVVTGTEDRLTPMKYGEYLHRNIPGAQLLVLQGCGHMMPLEDPDRFVRGVAAFIDI